MGGTARGMDGRMHPARGEGAGRLSRLAQGERRWRGFQGVFLRQPARRSNAAAPGGVAGRSHSQNAGARRKMGWPGAVLFETRRSDLPEMGLARLLA